MPNPTLQAILEAVKPDELYGILLRGGVDFPDTGVFTPVRLYQVLTAACSNGMNSDANNTSSLYNQTVYKDPDHPESGLTDLGYAFLTLEISSIGVGIVRELYKSRHKKTLNSVAYIREQLKKAGPDIKTLTDKEIDDKIYAARIAIMEKVLFQNMQERINALDKVMRAAEEAERENDAEVIDFQESSDVSRVVHLKKGDPARLSKVVLFLKKGKNFILNGVGNIWNFLSNQSMIFWAVYMPFLTVVGAAAIGSVMPVIILLTGAIGGGLLAYKLFHYLYEKISKKNKIAPNVNLENLDEKSFSPLEEIHRVFMKLEHQQWKERLAEAWIKKPPEAQKFFHATPPNPSSPFESELGKRLLGSRGERRARRWVTVASQLVTGFVLSVFVLWLLVSTAAVLPLAVAGVVGAYLAGTKLTFFTSISIGGIFGIKTFRKMRDEQSDYEKKVKDTLGAPYKDTKKTKLEVFKFFEHLVNQKKAAVEKIRKIEPNFEPDYKLNEINVYNDYYFEKQKQKPSVWTKIKKGANRFYNLFGGGQTGMFIVRILLLTGGIAASAVAAASGALFIFLAVAVVAAAVLGTLKLAQYQLDRNHQHREFFVDHIDDRINYLKKKDKELTALLALHELQKLEAQANLTPLRKEALSKPKGMQANHTALFFLEQSRPLLTADAPPAPAATQALSPGMHS